MGEKCLLINLLANFLKCFLFEVKCILCILLWEMFTKELSFQVIHYLILLIH